MDCLDLQKLVEGLVSLPSETEWVEFKLNFHSCEEIGERISALSNSAALKGKPYGYIVFGIENDQHCIKGTTFHAKMHKKGNEELEMWLTNRLDPKIDVQCHEFNIGDAHISMYIVPAATIRPVSFLHQSYIRVGSLTKLLKNYPEKEMKLWNQTSLTPIEKTIVKDGLTSSEVLSLISTETYFDRMGMPIPHDINGMIGRFISEKLIIKSDLGYAVTEMGAMLLAKDLRQFDNLHRKSVRIIVYRGKNKVDTIREQSFEQGYAVCFANMIDWINGQLPANEEIGKALRKNVRMYPEIAIREIVANMIIHQDFSIQGFPMVEIYSDRVEISSPGQPLISTARFIDEYQSRNDVFADIMRRMGYCEEKGSGLDKAVEAIELHQLPPIKFRVSETRTTVTIFAYKTWSEISKEERIQACYQHACLKYLSNEMMTNKSLRERFGVEEKNYSAISAVIKQTIEHGLIKIGTPDGTNRRNIAYIPSWG